MIVSGNTLNLDLSKYFCIFVSILLESVPEVVSMLIDIIWAGKGRY